MPRLGVNIDHVATVRQARKTYEPDPVWAAMAAQIGGADGITLHVREDRRHVNERDLRLLKETVQVRLNLEMAAEEEITRIALDVRPDQCTLVPEKREEVTTEGGLDVVGNREKVEACVRRLQEAGIEVSLFIDPEPRQVESAVALGVEAVELHTGRYADAEIEEQQDLEYDTLDEVGSLVVEAGMKLHMGHGLNYRNVGRIAEIPGTCELNIGHSIVARAIFVGFEDAVREMKELLSGAGG